MIKRWIESWKADRKAKRTASEIALLDRHLEDVKSPVTQKVQFLAESIARVLVLRWLDTNGFQHCAICPTRAPLRKINGAYACPNHFLVVEAQTIRAAQEAEAKEKQEALN